MAHVIYKFYPQPTHPTLHRSFSHPRVHCGPCLTRCCPPALPPTPPPLPPPFPPPPQVGDIKEVVAKADRMAKEIAARKGDEKAKAAVGQAELKDVPSLDKMAGEIQEVKGGGGGQGGGEHTWGVWGAAGLKEGACAVLGGFCAPLQRRPGVWGGQMALHNTADTHSVLAPAPRLQPWRLPMFCLS